jgi:hypothetical protein
VPSTTPQNSSSPDDTGIESRAPWYLRFLSLLLSKAETFVAELRLWHEQIDQGHPVDLSNKKTG